MIPGIRLSDFRCASVAVVLLAFLASLGAQENWPQFRGAESRGIGSGGNLPTVWSETKNVAWKTEVPGWGWSSPIVWGDRIFLTTVVREGKVETPKKGLYFGGNRLELSKSNQRYQVLCFDFNTGKLRWEKTVFEGAPKTAVHLKNTYASETPVTDGERVYAYFSERGLVCFDLDGKRLWAVETGSYKTRFGWGGAASPVLHGDRIYLVNDNDEQSFLLALDKLTGKTAWRVERDEKSNWATPFIWKNDLRTEIVTPGTGKVRSYDLEGKLLWQFGGMSSITIATPYSEFGLLYVTSGYVGDKRKPIFAVSPGASGDISLKPGETGNDHIKWFKPAAGPYNPSTIVYEDQLYVLWDFGFFSSHDARTGKPIYGKERINPRGRMAFTSSPWAYDGRIFCLDEDGVTYVFKAGPKYELLGKNTLDGMCMATPAIARDSLIIRSADRLYRIRN